jgi:hypothetical protein
MNDGKKFNSVRRKEGGITSAEFASVMHKRLVPAIRRFLADEDGAFLVEFAISFPVLILLSFGLMEFSLVVFDYQRAAEATRIGVRHTILNDAVANTTTLLSGSVITCTKPTNKVECVGGSPDDTADKQFRNMWKKMRGIYPSLKQENIIVSYQGTDVGEEDEFGGVFPMVTLQLVGVRHEMIVGHLIGIEYIEFPAFTTTVLGPGNYVNVAEQVKKKGNT